MIENTDTIEGRNPVFEALKSGRPIGKILLSKSVERHGVIADILHSAQTRGIPIEYVDRQIIDRMSLTSSNQGIIAQASAKEYIDLDELLAISREKSEAPFYIVLDGIEDPHNMGAILRTAEAAGAHGVVTRERRAVGLTSSVVRASAGAAEYVPVARVANISQTIEILKKNNVWVIGIDQDGKEEYTETDYQSPVALVIGSEGKGLSDLVKKRCDLLLHIPMKGKITSLNASVAAGVVMYEVVKQRSKK